MKENKLPKYNWLAYFLFINFTCSQHILAMEEKGKEDAQEHQETTYRIPAILKRANSDPGAIFSKKEEIANSSAPKSRPRRGRSSSQHSKHPPLPIGSPQTPRSPTPLSPDHSPRTKPVLSFPNSTKDGSRSSLTSPRKKESISTLLINTSAPLIMQKVTSPRGKETPTSKPTDEGMKEND